MNTLMKRLLRILVALPLLLAGCTHYEPAVGDSGFDSGDADHYVALDDAYAEVETILEGIDNSTRGGRIRTVGEAFSIGGIETTRAGDIPSPVYHIFNFEGGEGFAIASADDRTPPVVCITDSGTFSTDFLMGNGGAAMALDAFDTAYRVTVGLPVVVENGLTINPGESGYPDDPGWGAPMGGITDWGIDYGNPGGGNITRKSYPWTLSSTGGTEIPCRWGQERPYFNLMPLSGGKRCRVGCGAVAVAQILYHYGYPDHIGSYLLNWTVLRRHISWPKESYDPAHSMLARLFQQLNTSAYLNPCSVSVDETAVYTKNIAPAFRKLGFQCPDEAEYDHADVISAIRAGRPVIIFGNAIRTPVTMAGVTLFYNYESGHFWVCDRIMSYSKRYDTFRDGILVSTDYEYMHYVHCNWGWNGNYNGYFFINVFDALHAPTLPARSSEGEEYYYRYNMKMWNNIRR